MRARQPQRDEQTPPPFQWLHTTGLWWQAEPQTLEAAFASREQALDGFLGAAYALHHVAALVSLSERQDLARAVGDAGGTWFATMPWQR